MAEKMTKTNLPRLFGVFTPIGHVVLAFANAADAAQAREALLTGGYEADEVLQFHSDEVIADAEQTRDNLGLLARMGLNMEWSEVERDVQLAQQGAAFLVVYAPSDAETNRVMNVARRFNTTLARKYHRLAIEHLLG
jgi:hypothetical protein